MKHRRSAFVVFAILGGAGLALVIVASRLDQRWYERHVWQPLNILMADDFHSLRRLRAVLRVTGIVLLCASPPLAWLAGRVSPWNLLAGAGRIAVALLLVLPASELMLRARTVPSRPSWAELLEPDPRLGWTTRRSAQLSREVGGREITMAFNAEGARALDVQQRSDPAKPAILFAGESVVMGQGLRLEETWPALVAARLGVQAVNLGVVAYSTDQTLGRIEEALPRYAQPVAVVADFLPGQLLRNIDDDRPHLALQDDGTLAARTVSPPVLRLSRLVDSLPYTSERTMRRSILLTSALLREIARVTLLRGARPLFFVPSVGPKRAFEERGEAALLQEIFAELPLVVVDFDDRMRVPGDGHPDARANALFADAVASALLRPSP